MLECPGCLFVEILCMTKMAEAFPSASLQILFADEPYDCLLFGPYIVS